MKVCPTCGVEYPNDVLFCQRDGTTLRSADASRDLVGSVVADRYHVTKKLGEGGMGQVYLAEHVKMGRRCAIKIMSAGMINDPDAVSRFNREAANASRINHSNVCSIYDFGETSDHLIYLAMEYIEGKSLTDLLHEVGPLSLPRAASIISQCADALHAAHDLGIVHRDLKPDNIMVTTTRGKDMVKVVDFGIAKATGADSAGQKVTKTGLVVGTPEYMSPEQLSGDTLDGRSDIYSLGLVFYRMITGSLPFKADSAQETMIKRLTDDPLPLDQARPDMKFPPGLQGVLDKVLARWPMDRYASATEFARDVMATAGSMTGKVDVEGATVTVNQSDLKLPGGALPKTRVDTAAVQARQKAVVKAAADEGQAERDRKGQRSFPTLAVGVGIVVLALGGGAFAFKNKLIGPGPAVDTTKHLGITDTSHVGIKPDTPRVAVLTRQDSINQHLIPDPGRNRQHPGPNPPKDTSTAIHSQIVRDSALVNQELNNIQDSIVDAPQQRGALRSRAEAMFGESGLPATIRGKAAATVGQAYLEDANDAKSKGDSSAEGRLRATARSWFVKASALDSKNQKFVDNIDRTTPS